MNNNREQYAAYIQEDLQKLILIYSGCGCIALVMLLLIGNILTLEAEGEEREFGIRVRSECPNGSFGGS